jgi:hypothetical protein
MHTTTWKGSSATHGEVEVVLNHSGDLSGDVHAYVYRGSGEDRVCLDRAIIPGDALLELLGQHVGQTFIVGLENLSGDQVARGLLAASRGDDDG